MNKIKIFDNGLTMVACPMEGIFSTSIAVMVNVGSGMENTLQNGYSHFIEHMLFKGTSRRTSLEISEAIENIGGQLNAYTSKDLTCFYTKTASEHTESCMDLLSDMVFFSKFDPDEFERERKVVIEEIVMGDDVPDEVCQDLIAEAVFGSEGLGMTIPGPKENIESVTREQLLDFMTERYTPRNMCVAIAGDITYEQALELTEKYFLNNFPSQCETEKFIMPVQPTQTRYLKKVKSAEQCYLCLACPSPGLGNPVNYTNSVLSNILGGGMSSRLFQMLREKHGLCYTVFSYLSTYMNNGYFEIFVGTSPQNVKLSLELIREVCLKTATEGITEKELLRGREQFKGSTVLAFENSLTVATMIGGYALRNGVLLDMEERKKKIDSITLEDVNQAAKVLLDMENYSLAYVGKSVRSNLYKLLKSGK